MRTRILWVGLMVALAVGLTVTANPVQAVGTQSGDTVPNALQADTIAVSAGEMSVSFRADLSSDTQYQDTATKTTTTVDTGFDIKPITNVSDQSVTVGDSQVYGWKVTNRSNNAQNINFTVEGRDVSGTTSHFKRELFHENGDAGAGDDVTGYDTGSETRLTFGSGAGNSVAFAADETDTVYIVITAKASGANQAVDGDTIENEMFVTDNAPLTNSSDTNSDLWINGGPVSADNQDTQTDFFVTSVSGPDVRIAKSFTGVSQDDNGDSLYRPGDTIVFTITVDNDGAAQAVDVFTVDAIPTNTTYVSGSATIVSGTADTNKFSTDGIGFSSTESAVDDYQDSETSPVERVMFALDNLAADNGDGTGASNTNGGSDEATLEFRVTIN